MAPGGETPLDSAALAKALGPEVVLVPARLLRRVIKHDRKMTGLGLQVPHRKTYTIDSEALLASADREELELPSDRELPPRVILIERPDPEKLARMLRATALLRYWRLVFHAQVHLALDRRIAEHKLTDAGIRERIHRIGQTEFDEIRRVLRQEHYLLPPRDNRTVYVEFAAVYLELRYFAPALLPQYFPTIPDYSAIDAILAEDVDAAGLLAAARPAGAPDPGPQTTESDETHAGADDRPTVFEPTQRHDEGRYQRLVARAERVEALGNVVRAGILRMRAACVAAPEKIDETRAAARTDLDRLVSRLQAALQLDDAQRETWRNALSPLLEPAARGIWPTQARLLYDLQKVCVDHERDLYAVDLVEWFLSFGKRPVKRLLPGQRELLIVKHLRRAYHHLRATRFSGPKRRALAHLLETALAKSEEHLRERFRPVITTALAEVGLKPESFPEQIALNKLIEELLDRIDARGYLTMGDLRDALSRNNLWLSDLTGPKEFWKGDKLLRADRRLGVDLDGVYHRGEFYMRWLQRLSSLFFGTRVGRFLTRFVVIPFGGSYVALEALQHLIHPVADYFGIEVHLTGLMSVLLLGFFFLALMHVELFRRRVWQILVGIYRGGHALLIDLPAYVHRLPAVRAVLESRPFLLFYRYIFKPLTVAVVLGILFLAAGNNPLTALLYSAFLFLVVSLLLNSRVGRNLEEILTDRAVVAWQRLSIDLVPNVFRFVMDLFKYLLETVDRFLYSVDEWLRFRSGEGRLTLVTKAVLGLIWFCVTYVVRIYVNLLIEPQVNPIKHFPAVTVGHKVILPFTIILTKLLAIPLMPLGPYAANTIALINVTLLPGIFGFLVWEVKENWRLYRSNRAKTLRPVVVGSHGETMRRLLKPGFHSGTIPKLYVKLRRAERRAHRTGDRRGVEKHREGLHHAEESVRHFVERDLLAFLNGSKCWGAGHVEVGNIDIGSNRVRIELCCPNLAENGLWLSFEEQSGWLLAGISSAGWTARLSQDQLQVLRNALAGFYKMSCIDLIREQIQGGFEPHKVSYDIADEGLVVWPGPGYEAEAVYDLYNGPNLEPRIVLGPLPYVLPTLQIDKLLFSKVPITWEAWVETWERDQMGQCPPQAVLEDVRLVPTT